MKLTSVHQEQFSVVDDLVVAEVVHEGGAGAAGHDGRIRQEVCSSHTTLEVDGCVQLVLADARVTPTHARFYGLRSDATRRPHHVNFAVGLDESYAVREGGGSVPSLATRGKPLQ